MTTDGDRDLSSLSMDEIAQLIADKRLPPVDQWDPPACGHSAMRIDSDGRWWHEGSPINRPAMVRLFSTVLRREPDGSHVLVTPVEKLVIDVDDAPFVAIDVTHAGSGTDRTMAFRLSNGDDVIADAQHPIALRPGAKGDLRPYLSVRGGLDARLSRPVYYSLADIALQEGADPPGVWSCGTFFPFMGTGERLA